MIVTKSESMNTADPESETTQTSNPVSNNPSVGKGNSKYQVTIGKLDISVRSGFSTEGEIPLDTIKLPKSVLTKGNHVFVVDKIIKFINNILILNDKMVKYMLRKDLNLEIN